MIISLNWLKQFTAIDMPVDELITLIGARLVEVEAVTDIGDQYVGVVVARVVRVLPHPDADKLHVVHVDDNGVTQNVSRMENGLVELVCGAPNVREGIMVAWLPPGSTVPSSYHKEPFVMEARALRGVVSNGMLASPKELAIGDGHDGIAELDLSLEPGTSFAEAYQLNDQLIDIENKSLTHRPDCFGLIGFAREVAAICGQNFTTPDWLSADSVNFGTLVKTVDMPELSATVDSNVSARYELVALENIDATKASPFAMQTWLARVGLRPISAVVDITNYLMYVTGQPLHAFDLDKVLAVHPQHKADIVVRTSTQGETLALLDGRTVTLSDDDIVICAGATPIALAGAMGGASTEIDATTTRVLLEAATFDLYRLRTTQMRHAIFSEAITRFTKGQAPAQTEPVLARAVSMLNEIADGQRISEVIDSCEDAQEADELTIQAAHINAILGTDYLLDDMAAILARVEFAVAHDGKSTLKVRAPYWRRDIHTVEDIAEEIGRISGFDSITPVLPLRPFLAVMPSMLERQKSIVRHALVGAGANEILTYNFIPSSLLQKTGESADQAYRLVNSLSPELAYLRTSLLPSLLTKVHPNHKLGYDEFALFEMNKTHSKLELIDEQLPLERQMLSLVWSATDKAAKDYTGDAYYQAKHLLEYAAKALSVQLQYKPLHGSQLPAWLALHATAYEPKRAAVVYASETALGVVGELRAKVCANFKLPKAISGFEVDVEALGEARQNSTTYTPISRYPGTTRDITLQVPAEISYSEVRAAVAAKLSKLELETSIEALGIYQKPTENTKAITLRIGLTDHKATLSAEAANQLIAPISTLQF